MAAMTNSQAEYVATTLLAQRAKDIATLENTIKEKITGWYKAALPKEVLTAYENKKLKSFIAVTSWTYIRGVGIPTNWEKRYLSTDMPKSLSSPCIQLTDKEAEEFVKLDNQRATLKREYKQLHTEIQATLKSLTKKQIIQEFPEAARFFEEKKPTTALAINIEDLRKRIPL